MLNANNPNSIGSIPYRLNGNSIPYKLIPPKNIRLIPPNVSIILLKIVVVVCDGIIVVVLLDTS
jgi:hypothetical protein